MQASRSEVDEWQTPIESHVIAKGLTDISVLEALTQNQVLRMEARDIGQREQNRAARILRGLGFTRYRCTLADGSRPWRYRKA
jgi:hypothetical protein